MSSTPPGHVICSFTVNGIKSTELPNDFELREEWGKHDLFFVRLVVPKGKVASKLKTWPDGAAVEVRWGRLPGGGLQTWYGYVNHHVLTTNDDLSGQNVQITYVLIGTSKVMNGDKNRTWINTTPEGIAQRIARENSLRCVVTQTKWELKYEVQAHESDFLFLNRIADKVGFRFWVSGGTLYFIDPIVILAGHTTNTTPTYVINKAPYTMDGAADFQILQGDAIPGGFTQVDRVIYGLDYNTGRLFKQKTKADPGPVDFDHISDPKYRGKDPHQGDIVNKARHVTNQGEAKKLQNSQQALSQFWIFASVEVFGNVVLYPGKSVNLSGAMVPRAYWGGWIVTSVQHVGRISRSSNATEDSMVSRLTIAHNQKTRIPHIKGIHLISPEMIDCNLSGGKWKAASLNVILEGVVGR